MEIVDPRLYSLRKKLEKIKHVVPVMSVKGGVGKTLFSTVLALKLATKFKTGLLDLDLTNPSTHVVLGINLDEVTIEEEKGVKPPVVYGVEYMTIAFFAGENPLPLRGNEIDEVFKEILVITNWGEIDYLVIDTPPGLYDPVLNIISYIKEIKPIIISTPSPLAINSVAKLLKMLTDEGVKVLGIVENMANKPSPQITEIARRFNVRYLGNIPYVNNIDEYVGDPDRLLKTMFARIVENIVEEVLLKQG